jgi:hypothetical protein
MVTADRPPPEARVGLVADSDFPHQVARHLRAELPEIVDRWLGVECGVELDGLAHAVARPDPPVHPYDRRGGRPLHRSAAQGPGTAAY